MAFACEQFGVSERRACKLIAMDRSSYRYEPRPDHNAAFARSSDELARQKPRYGYRRLHALLRLAWSSLRTPSGCIGCTGPKALWCGG